MDLCMHLCLRLILILLEFKDLLYIQYTFFLLLLALYSLKLSFDMF